MYASGPVPYRDTRPRIGEWISEAFNLFGQQWQTWVLQGLVYTLLAYGPLLLAMVVYVGAIFSVGIAAGVSGSGNVSDGSAAVVGLLVMALYVGGFVLYWFLHFYLTAGMMRSAARQLRGETITVRDVFSAGDVFWSLAGASILMYLAVSVGVIFCIVPGLLLAALFSFTHVLIAEERLGPVEAMQRSWEITKPHMWMYLLWAIVINLVGSIGAYLCYVGIAATIPLYAIGTMIAYRDVVGLPGALSRHGAPAVIPAPAVNYGPAGPPVAAGACPACGRPVAAGAVVCPSCQSPIPAAGAVPPYSAFTPPPPDAPGWTPPPPPGQPPPGE